MNERTKEDFRKFYDILDIIGGGGYGYIYKGIEKKTKEKRAIKVIDLSKIKDDLLSQFETEEVKDQIHEIILNFKKEYENMKICSNNNINSVKCYEYFNTEDNFVIIMELCDTNLSEFLLNYFEKNERGFFSTLISAIRLNSILIFALPIDTNDLFTKVSVIILSLSLYIFLNIICMYNLFMLHLYIGGDKDPNTKSQPKYNAINMLVSFLLLYLPTIFLKKYISIWEFIYD
jgi:serine/threonine protein kinase